MCGLIQSVREVRRSQIIQFKTGPWGAVRCVPGRTAAAPAGTVAPERARIQSAHRRSNTIRPQTESWRVPRYSGV
jgi:hypothetical protein